jgi:hypothetical protein
MNYPFDHNRFIRLLLPSFLRKPIQIAWLSAVTAPMVTIYGWFLDLMARLNVEAVLNGQTAVLEWLLNNRFDNTLRRIRIVTLISVVPIRAYLQSENRPRLDAYLQSEGQPKMLTNEFAEYSTGNFVVRIPLDLDGQQTAIRRLTDKYRLASKTYSVVVE